MREEKEILDIKPMKMSKILAWQVLHLLYLLFVTPFQSCNMYVEKAQATYDLMFG